MFRSSFHFNDASLLSPEEAWKEFETQHPSRRSCLRALYERMSISWMNECPHCHSKQVVHTNDYRSLKCASCHRESWFTASTFLANIRQPRAWLGAIWLIERRVVVNAFTLHKLAGIAYSTALVILKKLMFLIDSQFEESLHLVPSRQFASVFCKRSRETPARAHPIAEEDVFDHPSKGRVNTSAGFHAHTNDQPEIMPSCPAPETSQPVPESSVSDARQAVVLKELSHNPLHIDTICQRTGLPIGDLNSILTMLELFGAATRLAGERYTAVRVCSSRDDSESPATQKTIADISLYVKSVFRGISRKYLQEYVALYWYYQDVSAWPAGLLLQLCSNHAFIRARDVCARVCPLKVKITKPIPEDCHSKPAVNFP